jgi:ABC-2 type transport system ATP-binding protein
MMVGLLHPTSGHILINGKDISKIDKGIIGICPQELVYWEHLTCKENLKFIGDMYDVPKDILDSRINELLEKLFLVDKKDVLASKLSGGMKRRLNLALAVVYDPKIIVLDEPSEGLDPQSRRVLWNYINTLRDESKTVILTTHLMDEADKLSDRIAIMDHGKLLCLDTPDNLKKEIGEGDVVDIKLFKEEYNKDIISSLKEINGILSVIEVDGSINIRSLDIVSKLPKIIETIESKNLKIKDLSLRQNTLEDVFIELTGSKLRE